VVASFSPTWLFRVPMSPIVLTAPYRISHEKI